MRRNMKKLIVVLVALLFCGTIRAEIMPGGHVLSSATDSVHVESPVVVTGTVAVTGATFTGTVNTDTNIRPLTAATDTVHLDSPVVVTATSLSIRPLTAATDTVHLDSPVVVTATSLSIRPLTAATDTVHVESPILATVSATALDIRPLSKTTDTVHVESPILATVSGAVTVSGTAIDIRPLTAATDTVHVESPILATVSGTATVTIAQETATETWINLTLTTNGVEYTATLPAKCIGYQFQCRMGYDIKWGKAGETGTNYYTLKSGYYFNTFAFPNRDYASAVLAFQSAQPAVVVEIYCVLRQ
jgi:hypothetical protein